MSTKNLNYSLSFLLHAWERRIKLAAFTFLSTSIAAYLLTFQIIIGQGTTIGKAVGKAVGKVNSGQDSVNGQGTIGKAVRMGMAIGKAVGMGMAISKAVGMGKGTTILLFNLLVFSTPSSWPSVRNLHLFTHQQTKLNSIWFPSHPYTHSHSHSQTHVPKLALTRVSKPTLTHVPKCGLTRVSTPTLIRIPKTALTHSLNPFSPASLNLLSLVSPNTISQVLVSHRS